MSQNVQRYTPDAIEIDGYIILFIADKQYGLDEGENGFVANDVTMLDFWNGGLLEQANFEDYFYDENACVYVNNNYIEAGMRVEIRFENGMIISSTNTYTDEENDWISQLLFTKIGTTTIEIPDFTFYYDLEVDPKYLVTEEIWNSYLCTTNFTATLYALIDVDYYEHTVKSTGEAYEIDGNIIVSDSGKKYVLEETDGIFYAKEYDGIYLPDCLMPESLSFSDFEFNKQGMSYVWENEDGTESYKVAFDNGVLCFVQIERTPDPENPYYTEFIVFEITEIGTAVIDVPDYVIE